MPYIDRQNGELVIRIVYDGSPEAGKTTNVRALSTLLSMQRRGQVVAPGTTSRRTEFFDWLDFSGGYVDGRRLRCQLVSVPGQPSLLRRRRYLLESADAVVFVADSHPFLVEESRQSFRQLREMLVRVEGELPIGVVLQANKQDRPNALTPSALANRLAVGATVPVVGARAHEAEGVRESFLLASRLATERVRALLARESVAETGLGSAESLHEAMLAHGLGALLEERTDARVVPMARASTAPVVLRATLDDHVGRPSELELAFAAATVAADVVGADAAAAHAADVETDATAAHAADDTTEGPGADDPTAPDLELEADDDYLALELRPVDAAEIALDARADDEVDAADELAGETVDDVDVVDVGDHDDVHVGVAVTEPDAGCAAYADPLEPSSNHGPEARHAPDLAARAPAEGDSCAPSAPHETPVAGELSSRPPPCETPQPAIGDLPPGVELPPSSEVIGDLPPGVELPPASELPPGCAWPPVHGRALYTAATLGALTRRERRPWAPRDAIELCSDRGLLLHTCDRWQVPELESARRSLLEVVRALVPWTSVLPEERALILAPTRDGWTIWMISPAAPTLADALASAAVDDLDELTTRMLAAWRALSPEVDLPRLASAAEGPRGWVHLALPGEPAPPVALSEPTRTKLTERMVAEGAWPELWRAEAGLGLPPPSCDPPTRTDFVE
ncbi:MAG: hypothetical protein KF901_16895 [Myxococcales bacterium]|nr:hypothetical protein [Myxococcales bacterium]